VPQVAADQSRSAFRTDPELRFLSLARMRTHNAFAARSRVRSNLHDLFETMALLRVSVELLMNRRCDDCRGLKPQTPDNHTIFGIFRFRLELWPGQFGKLRTVRPCYDYYRWRRVETLHKRGL
jgi:hypothetical protein